MLFQKYNGIGTLTILTETTQNPRFKKKKKILKNELARKLQILRPENERGLETQTSKVNRSSELLP